MSHAAALKVLHKRSGKAFKIDSTMVVKPGIFSCEDRFLKDRRDLVQRYDITLLSVHPADLLSVLVEDHAALRHDCHLVHVIASRSTIVDSSQNEQRENSKDRTIATDAQGHF